jgi:arylsulfatase A-like enzyme
MSPIGGDWRSRLTIAALFTAALAPIAPSAPAVGAAPPPDRPNILLIVTDDQTYSTWSRDLMPSTFAQLVDKGVTFNRGYVSSSLCCPSRSEILTGLYEHHTGVDRNKVSLTRPTFVEALHSLGYRTMLDGKYLNSWPCIPRAEFDRWVCSSRTNTLVNPKLNVDGAWKTYTGWTPQVLANFGIDFIAHTPTDQPYFLMYTPKDPHLPADDTRYQDLQVDPVRSPNWDEETRTGKKPQYLQRGPLTSAEINGFDHNHEIMAQAVRGMDDDIGALLASLGDREPNTLVVFLSDNGYVYGEHRQGGKDIPYEESVRVPFVVRYPPLVPEDQPFASDALVMNVDIAPTIADLVGLDWGADGASMVPLLTGQATSIRTGALIEHCQGVTYPCYGLSGMPSVTEVVTSQYAYMEYLTNERELYDLVADPYELNNLAGDPSYADVQAQLADQLASLRAPPVTDTVVAAGALGTAHGRTLKFTYFSQSRFARYQCRVDTNGPPGPWFACDGQSTSVGPLADGNYTFEVAGTDEHGVADPTPATRAFSIKETGPDVQVTSAPPAHMKERTATFAFAGGQGATTYQCRLSPVGAGLVPGRWKPCLPAGVTYPNLSDGVWNFEVRASDGLGGITDPPAAGVFQVDNRGPSMVIDSAPAAATQDTTASFAFHASEATSGTWTCVVDAGPAEDCTSGTLTETALAEGSHTLSVTATDTLGNTRTSLGYWWTVDLTAPTVNVTGGPPPNWNQPVASFTLAYGAGGVAFDCSIDQVSLICPFHSAFYGLTDGAHTFQVQSFDAAGNLSDPAVVTWAQDTVAPITTITSGPPLVTTDTTATFEFTADEPGTSFQCELDTGGWLACSSPAEYSGLGVGTHTFLVYATDQAGNAGGSASYTWTVTT